jgi:hypothetical protein
MRQLLTLSLLSLAIGCSTVGKRVANIVQASDFPVHIYVDENRTGLAEAAIRLNVDYKGFDTISCPAAHEFQARDSRLYLDRNEDKKVDEGYPKYFSPRNAQIVSHFCVRNLKGFSRSPILTTDFSGPYVKDSEQNQPQTL